MTSAPKLKLTDAQRRVYAAEKLMNFRLLARLFATRSSSYPTLTKAVRVPAELQRAISDIGQFAGLACGAYHPEFVWREAQADPDADAHTGSGDDAGGTTTASTNASIDAHSTSVLETLTQPGWPLAGYDALRGAELIRAFKGCVTQLQGLVVYRRAERQAVVAFSGTVSLAQVLQDLDARLVRYPNPNPDPGPGKLGLGGKRELNGDANHKGESTSTSKKKKRRKPKVHAGFWRLFKGLHAFALEALHECLQSRDVQEIVITGHSLGAAQAHLFAMELLQSAHDVLNMHSGIPLKFITFGCPRIGNSALADLFRELVHGYRERHGDDALVEHCVRNYADGANCIPTRSLRYRHLSCAPLYGYNGYLYYIPETEKECTEFRVEPDDDDLPPDFPRGGHNYYNNRDMEKAWRLYGFLEIDKRGEEGWRERYMRYLEVSRSSSQ